MARAPSFHRVHMSSISHQSPNIIFVALISIISLFVHVQSKVVSLPKTNENLGKYPMTTPEYTKDGVKFKVGVIADNDGSAVSGTESHTWLSTYLTGTLTWNNKTDQVSVEWNKENKTIKGRYSYGGRGMELSELLTYHEKLLAFDDKTGLVYVLTNKNLYTWVVLADGDGTVNRGYKAEWAAEKDGFVYVGSTGKEWTTPNGTYVNDNPMWVKMINKNGRVTSLNWKNHYIAMKNQAGAPAPGYLIHEAATWSDIQNKWFFLPRKMSTETYNDALDESKGTNLLISCDANFKEFNVVKVGPVVPTHGFSSFKFVPGSQDTLIVATKTEEHGDTVGSYIMAFHINGTVVMEETKIDDNKYEGFDFV